MEEGGGGDGGEGVCTCVLCVCKAGGWILCIIIPLNPAAFAGGHYSLVRRHWSFRHTNRRALKADVVFFVLIDRLIVLILLVSLIIKFTFWWISLACVVALSWRHDVHGSQTDLCVVVNNIQKVFDATNCSLRSYVRRNDKRGFDDTGEKPCKLIGDGMLWWTERRETRQLNRIKKKTDSDVFCGKFVENRVRGDTQRPADGLVVRFRDDCFVVWRTGE